VASVAILVPAAAANAQSATGQYDPTLGGPTLDQAGIVQTGSVGDGAGNAGAGEGGGAAGEVQELGGNGTELPFTGYPLSLLVVIAGLMLGGGLLVRLVIRPAAARGRA
jgi:hypothetical protein